MLLIKLTMTDLVISRLALQDTRSLNCNLEGLPIIQLTHHIRNLIANRELRSSNSHHRLLHLTNRSSLRNSLVSSHLACITKHLHHPSSIKVRLVGKASPLRTRTDLHRSKVVRPNFKMVLLSFRVVRPNSRMDHIISKMGLPRSRMALPNRSVLALQQFLSNTVSSNLRVLTRLHRMDPFRCALETYRQHLACLSGLLLVRHP